MYDHVSYFSIRKGIPRISSVHFNICIILHKCVVFFKNWLLVDFDFINILKVCLYVKILKHHFHLTFPFTRCWENSQFTHLWDFKRFLQLKTILWKTMMHFLLFPMKTAGNLLLSIPVEKWNTLCQTSFPNGSSQTSRDIWKVLPSFGIFVTTLFLVRPIAPTWRNVAAKKRKYEQQKVSWR